MYARPMCLSQRALFRCPNLQVSYWSHELQIYAGCTLFSGRRRHQKYGNDMGLGWHWKWNPSRLMRLQVLVMIPVPPLPIDRLNLLDLSIGAPNLFSVSSTCVLCLVSMYMVPHQHSPPRHAAFVINPHNGPYAVHSCQTKLCIMF
jgi:hypothetical protein